MNFLQSRSRLRSHIVVIRGYCDSCQLLLNLPKRLPISMLILFITLHYYSTKAIAALTDDIQEMKCDRAVPASQTTQCQASPDRDIMYSTMSGLTDKVSTLISAQTQSYDSNEKFRRSTTATNRSTPAANRDPEKSYQR